LTFKDHLRVVFFLVPKYPYDSIIQNTIKYELPATVKVHIGIQ